MESRFMLTCRIIRTRWILNIGKRWEYSLLRNLLVLGRLLILSSLLVLMRLVSMRKILHGVLLFFGVSTLILRPRVILMYAGH